MADDIENLPSEDDKDIGVIDFFDDLSDVDEERDRDLPSREDRDIAVIDYDAPFDDQVLDKGSRPYEGPLSPTGKSDSGDITAKDILKSGTDVLGKILDIVRDSQKPPGREEPSPKRPTPATPGGAPDFGDIPVKVPTSGKKEEASQAQLTVLEQVRALLEAQAK
jgi:hypothetical protein